MSAVALSLDPQTGLPVIPRGDGSLLNRFGRSLLQISPTKREAYLYDFASQLPLRFIQATPDRPYLERYFLAREGDSFAYLHRFVNGDGDRSVHNHPWHSARSLILAGGYREIRREKLDGQECLKKLLPGDMSFIGPTTLHRITDTDPETWTLFVHGPWIRDWGFFDEGGVFRRMQAGDDGENRFWWEKPEHAPAAIMTKRAPRRQAARA